MSRWDPGTELRAVSLSFSTPRSLYEPHTPRLPKTSRICPPCIERPHWEAEVCTELTFLHFHPHTTLSCLWASLHSCTSPRPPCTPPKTRVGVPAAVSTSLLCVPLVDPPCLDAILSGMVGLCQILGSHGQTHLMPPFPSTQHNARPGAELINLPDEYYCAN